MKKTILVLMVLALVSCTSAVKNDDRQPSQVTGDFGKASSTSSFILSCSPTGPKNVFYTLMYEEFKVINKKNAPALPVLESQCNDTDGFEERMKNIKLVQFIPFNGATYYKHGMYGWPQGAEFAHKIILKSAEVFKFKVIDEAKLQKYILKKMSANNSLAGFSNLVFNALSNRDFFESEN